MTELHSAEHLSKINKQNIEQKSYLMSDKGVCWTAKSCVTTSTVSRLKLEQLDCIWIGDLVREGHFVKVAASLLQQCRNWSVTNILR